MYTKTKEEKSQLCTLLGCTHQNWNPLIPAPRMFMCSLSQRCVYYFLLKLTTSPCSYVVLRSQPTHFTDNKTEAVFQVTQPKQPQGLELKTRCSHNSPLKPFFQV